VTTHEPGATATGRRLRELLLHSDALDPRAEALLFAADRAQHVATVVRPALERGAIVVTDRYSDSSVAYQGAGRSLDGAEVAQLSRWATRDLVPDLTVVLDVPPDVGRTRLGGRPDRLESEPEEFHASVRQRFLDLARRHPRRYLVVDASADLDAVQRQLRQRLSSLLPLSPRQRAEIEARAERERAAGDDDRTQALDLSGQASGLGEDPGARRR
jgi:dTMP kinase